MSEKECACCQSQLNQDDECPNGCTEDPAYGVAEGAHQWDEETFAEKTGR